MTDNLIRSVVVECIESKFRKIGQHPMNARRLICSPGQRVITMKLITSGFIGNDASILTHSFSRCLDSSRSDYVEFSNFNIHLMDRKMSRMCGSKEDNFQRSVVSDGNFFRVTFKSNADFDATGFEAFYQFRKIEGVYGPVYRKLI